MNYADDRDDGQRAVVPLRVAGALEAEDERRRLARVPLAIVATRARRWSGGAWRDLEATVVDLSARGVGLRLDREVHIGDRLSLMIPLDHSDPDLRVTIEVRHVRADAGSGRWRAGGLFRTLAPADYERIICFVFGRAARHRRHSVG